MNQPAATQTVTLNKDAELGIALAEGSLLVMKVDPTSQAKQAGVKPGLFIITVNGQSVATQEEFFTVMGTATSSSIELTLSRGPRSSAGGAVSQPAPTSADDIDADLAMATALSQSEAEASHALKLVIDGANRLADEAEAPRPAVVRYAAPEGVDFDTFDLVCRICRRMHLTAAMLEGEARQRAIDYFFPGACFKWENLLLEQAGLAEPSYPATPSSELVFDVVFFVDVGTSRSPRSLRGGGGAIVCDDETRQSSFLYSLSALS